MSFSSLIRSHYRDEIQFVASCNPRSQTRAGYALQTLTTGGASLGEGQRERDIAMFSFLAPLAAADRIIVPWMENEVVGPFAGALKNCVRRSIYGAHFRYSDDRGGDCPYRAWCAALEGLAFKLRHGTREEKKAVTAFLRDVEEYLPAELESDPAAIGPRLHRKQKKARSVA